MRKYLILLALVSVSLLGNSQTFIRSTGWGYEFKRGQFDSTLFIPTGCGTPSGVGSLRMKGLYKSQAALYFDSCAALLYAYNPKDKTWSSVSGGSADEIWVSKSITKDTLNQFTLGSSTADIILNIPSGYFPTGYRLIEYVDSFASSSSDQISENGLMDNNNNTFGTLIGSSFSSSSIVPSSVFGQLQLGGSNSFQTVSSYYLRIQFTSGNFQKDFTTGSMTYKMLVKKLPD